MADYVVHGLDTNVLLRYVLEDDEKQFARASRLIEDELTPRQPGHCRGARDAPSDPNATRA